ncbi:VTT domain-containing protein [Halogeometricum sp. S1BR25-6]|uniref:VTT domain-containing protein n=1 Tax=Halogeometricum salsisoli TaxID=2950536 RepID=A0ABU2G8V5_9EURY|nr:VTT domain-containing protein [Halogeometricum sp. S1BR25-6]MDS0297243.1 VTT domain-containing protein [Halogeometricum sp. S1BR25-6]
MSLSLVSVVAAGLALPGFGDGVVAEAVRAASGWGGLLLIFVYSVLIAVVLPLPGEAVLVPAVEGTLKLGVPTPVEIALVIVVSSLGKALGSVVALSLGNRATRYGPVTKALRSVGFDPVGWSKRRVVELVRRHGYVGLAGTLMVPVFPDTLLLYAFAVLNLERTKFAAAAFVGTVGRLLITLFVLESVSSVS